MLKISAPMGKMEKQKTHPLPAFILFISMIGALFSMLQISPPQTPGMVPLAESFRVLFNLLFTISEQNQAYLYERFTVSVPPESYANYATVALGILVLLTAVYIAVMQKLKSKAMCAALFLLCTGVQIYFGVFAAPVWNVLLYAALAWFLLRGANPVVFAAAVMAVALVALLLFPGQSPWLLQTSETIRDRFGNTQERPMTVDATTGPGAQDTTQAQDLQVQAEAADYGDTPAGQTYGIDREERFSGSQIGAAIGQRLWVLWLIGAAFVAGFALWFLTRIVAAYMRQAVFNSPDCAAAIDSMFKHLVEWLAAFGIARQNSAYAAYATGVDAALPGNFAQNYLEMVDLWQKSAYSNHAMTENDRRRMRGFLDDTRHALAKSVNPFVRVRLKLRLLLQSEM